MSFQVKEAAGDPNFEPMVEIPDPDLSVHEAVNQILLKGNCSTKARKRLDATLARPPQESSISEVLSSGDQYQMNHEMNMEDYQSFGVSDHSYTLLTPADVSQTWSEIEAGKCDNLLNVSGTTDSIVGFFSH